MSAKPPSPREMGYYFSLAQIGLEMVAPIGVGVLLDVFLNTMPWGIIGGAVCGFTCGFVHLLALVSQHDKTDASNNDNDNDKDKK